MSKDLSDYILNKLRLDGEVNLKLVSVVREYDTIYGKKKIEEINLIVDDLVIEDFGIEAFEGIEI